MKTLSVGSLSKTGQAAARRWTLQDALLSCGILSSLLYAGAMFVAPLFWTVYSSGAQAVSELSAFGAPSRPFMVTCLTLYNFLVIAFAIGIRSEARGRFAWNALAVLFIVYGVSGLPAPFMAMNLAGAERTLSDTLHILLTVVDVLLIFLMLGFGLFVLGKRFRLFTAAVILVQLASGTLSGMMAPKVAANIEAGLSTPWFGVIERVLILSFLLWVAVFAVNLLRGRGKTI